MAPSIEFQGGPPTDDVFTAHPLGRAADPAAVTAVVAGLAGFFIRQSLRPPPPGPPTLREAQAAHGRVVLDRLAVARRVPGTRPASGPLSPALVYRTA
jgi:hypothetical protein